MDLVDQISFQGSHEFLDKFLDVSMEFSTSYNSSLDGFSWN